MWLIVFFLMLVRGQVAGCCLDEGHANTCHDWVSFLDESRSPVSLQMSFLSMCVSLRAPAPCMRAQKSHKIEFSWERSGLRPREGGVAFVSVTAKEMWRLWKPDVPNYMHHNG